MPPEMMYKEAEAETNYRDLKAYCSVIGLLRDKGFSYRDIALWLCERGIGCDHNAVYRVYMSSLSDEDAALDARQEEEDEKDDANQNT